MCLLTSVFIHPSLQWGASSGFNIMQTLETLPNIKCTNSFKSKKILCGYSWDVADFFSFLPSRCSLNCAFIYKWKSVSLHYTFRPVGPGLCWEGVQSGWVSDSSCCLSEMWTSRWPDHTPSRAASEALSALPPPPDQTDIFYMRFRKNNKQWHGFFLLSYERTTFASGTLAGTQVCFSLHCWTVTGKNPELCFVPLCDCQYCDVKCLKWFYWQNTSTSFLTPTFLSSRYSILAVL